MKIKQGDVLVYKEPDAAARYGTGVLVSITSEEYEILWSGRGTTRYKRAILDAKMDQVLSRVESETSLPKERRLKLGASKSGIPFNEHYDRARIESLCEQLKSSGASDSKVVAEGLATELFTKKLALKGAGRKVLLQLAELCNARSSTSYNQARDISRELFFGYILQKSDFVTIDAKS